MKKLLTSLAMMGALAGAQETSAQETRIEDPKEITKEIIMQQDSTRKDLVSTINRSDAVNGDSIITKGDTVELGEGIEIEPDSKGDDVKVEGEDKDSKEKSELPVKFTISTGLGYSVGGKAVMCNRIAGSGQLFKGTKAELGVYSHIDFDDPLNSKGSGKLSLSKSIYKGITLDGDYTFTGTGGNILRFGIGYGGQIGKGQYGIKLYPLNTNGSPIAAKVSVGTKVGKDGQLSSFVFVDFKNMQYYSETEYVHQIAQGIGLFVQARLGGIMDGRITEKDSQQFVGGVRFEIK